MLCSSRGAPFSSPVGPFMNLYLSSYRLGGRGAELAAMVAGRKHVALVRNAVDAWDDAEQHRVASERERDALADLGIPSAPLDLRDYFGAPDALREDLRSFDGLWVTGGNTFVLRRAMGLSGLDALLRERVADASFTYGGYSAGACVLAPTLRGIHVADEPEMLPPGYRGEVPWEGVGILPFCIVPHYRSDHPESPSMEGVVEYMMAHQLPFIALRDGDAYVRRSGQPFTSGA
jgi:dipeptidase E